MLTFTTPRPDSERPDHAHQQLIGYIGLILPFLLIALAIARDGLTRWKELDSISAYYYTGALAAFVGMLVSLALFLFTYRGYKNKYQWADRFFSTVAAVAALGVAFFPATAPAGVPPLVWWSKTTLFIHYFSAGTLFSMFAIFSLWLFRITPDKDMASPGKRWRNRIYLVCGLLIVAGMVWVGIAGHNKQSIFWPESLVLIAFSISWLVKGQAHATVVSAVRSLTR